MDVRLLEKGYSNSHGARPVHSIMTIVNRIRTSRSSIKNSLSPPPTAGLALPTTALVEVPTYPKYEAAVLALSLDQVGRRLDHAQLYSLVYGVGRGVPRARNCFSLCRLSLSRISLSPDALIHSPNLTGDGGRVVSISCAYRVSVLCMNCVCLAPGV